MRKLVNSMTRKYVLCNQQGKEKIARAKIHGEELETVLYNIGMTFRGLLETEINNIWGTFRELQERDQ